MELIQVRKLNEWIQQLKHQLKRSGKSHQFLLHIVYCAVEYRKKIYFSRIKYFAGQSIRQFLFKENNLGGN